MVKVRRILFLGIKLNAWVDVGDVDTDICYIKPHRLKHTFTLLCCSFFSLLDKVYPRCWLRLGGLPIVIVVVVVASRCLSPSTTRSPWLAGGNKNTCKLNEGTHELTSRVRV